MVNETANSSALKWITHKYFYYVMFTVVVIMAIVLRLQTNRTERLWPDEAYYGWIAKKIYENPAFIISPQASERHPPLFSALLSSGYFFDSSEAGLRNFTLIINITTILLLCRLAFLVGGYYCALISTLFLALNSADILSSGMILPDGFLVMMYVLLMLQLIHKNLSSSYRRDILIGLTILVTILIKWSGVIMMPLFLAYYLTSFPSSLPVWARLRKIAVVFVVVGIPTVLIFLTGTRPDLTAIKGAYFIKPFTFYILNWHLILNLPAYVVILFIIGLFSSFKKGRRTSSLLFVSFFIPLLCYSLSAEKDARYILPILPSILLAASLGLEAIILLIPIKKYQSAIRLALIPVVLLTLTKLMVKGSKRISVIDHSYIGFKEAGQVVKSIADANSLIFTDSTRAIRFYTDIEFVENGGNISEFPKNENDFDQIVMKNTDKNIILIIDSWQYTQPDWVLNMTPEKMEKLNRKGFVLKKAVAKYLEDKKQYNVVWVMEKPALNEVN